MTAVARVGDVGSGICYLHTKPTPYTVVFSTGSTTVGVEGKPMCSVGSVGIASCGHPTLALTGSSSVFVNGQPVHRIGDTGANGGPYVVTLGSPTTSSN